MVFTKWISVVCLIMLVCIADYGIVHASSDDVPDRGKAEAPPDYGAMRLVGAMQVGRSAVVVFENAKGEQAYYPVGRTFSDGSKVTTVKDKSIIVRRADGSAVEYFMSPGEAGKTGTASVGRPVIETSPPPGVPDSERSAGNRRQRLRDLRAE